jgi:hypothetical protein
MKQLAQVLDGVRGPPHKTVTMVTPWGTLAVAASQVSTSSLPTETLLKYTSSTVWILVVSSWCPQPPRPPEELRRLLLRSGGVLSSRGVVSWGDRRGSTCTGPHLVWASCTGPLVCRAGVNRKKEGASVSQTSSGQYALKWSLVQRTWCEVYPSCVGLQCADVSPVEVSFLPLVQGECRASGTRRRRWWSTPRRAG